MANLEQMREGWDTHAESYDEAITPFSTKVAEAALRIAGVKAGMKLLETNSTRDLTVVVFLAYFALFAAFVQAASEETGVKAEILKRDVGRILLKLEELQEARLRAQVAPEPVAVRRHGPDVPVAGAQGLECDATIAKVSEEQLKEILEKVRQLRRKKKNQHIESEKVLQRHYS